MRTLIDKLCDLKVEGRTRRKCAPQTYTNKVDTICMQLQGTNKLPVKVSLLITIGLKTSMVEEFCLATAHSFLKEVIHSS